MKRKSSSLSSSLIVELASSRYSSASLVLVAADVATVATAATDVQSFDRSIVRSLLLMLVECAVNAQRFFVRWWVGWLVGWLVGGAGKVRRGWDGRL